MDGAHQLGTFDQLISRGRKEAAFGNSATPVAGPAEALERYADGTRRPNVEGQIDMSNVNAQFERSGRHQDLEFAILELTFPTQPNFAPLAPMLRTYPVF